MENVHGRMGIYLLPVIFGFLLKLHLDFGDRPGYGIDARIDPSTICLEEFLLAHLGHTGIGKESEYGGVSLFLKQAL